MKEGIQEGSEVGKGKERRERRKEGDRENKTKSMQEEKRGSYLLFFFQK